MKGFGSFVTVFSSVLALVGASNVLDLDPKNFDQEILKSGKPALVEFFAPWCGHCKTLAPIYEELADSLAGMKDKVIIAKVDADNHKSLGKRFGVQGFPTLKWFDGKSDQPIAYDSKRDLESLQAFVTDKLGVKPPKVKKEAPSSVIDVNDANFDSIVLDSGKNVLVEFYAPWCGHCKSLAPIYETVAKWFKPETTVAIVKINADAPNGKATAARYGVTGYPTLKWFPKGSTEPVDYDSSRTVEAIVDFINEFAGTHRAVGGGLQSTAGRVRALDIIVRHMVEGKEAEKAEELKEAAKELEGVYAQYYVKALAKILKNRKHAEQELRRLTNMMVKGGLTPEKHDDLTIRRNILTQFYSAKMSADAPVAKDEL